MVSRGRCTGPLQADLPKARVDELGRVYLPDSAWLGAAACRPDGRWYTCPIGQVQHITPLIEIYRRHKSGLEPLATALVRPSAAAFDLVEWLDACNVELAMVEMRPKTPKATPGGRPQKGVSVAHG